MTQIDKLDISSFNEVNKKLAEQSVLLKKMQRELKIEAALEKVRTACMGMQCSDELHEVIKEVFTQINLLGIRADMCSIDIPETDSQDFFFWIATPDTEYPQMMRFPYFDHPMNNTFINARKENQLLLVESFSKVEKDTWFKHAFIHSKLKHAPAHRKEYVLKAKGFARTVSFTQHIGILMANYDNDPFTDEDNNILVRFTKVFDQAYTRFLDLQKAEAQAREAQIEAALERVRARAMAMYHGDELADVSKLLFEQISILGIKPRSCGFLIMDNEKKSMEDWSSNADEHGKSTFVIGNLAYDQHPLIAQVVATWQRGEPYFIGEIHGKDLQAYYQAVTSTETSSTAIKEKILAVSTSEYTNSFNFEFGMMYVLTPYPLAENQINLLLRFAKVFKLTYTRFLDLQKAEAQAREAQIEAGLERVRSRSLAMHHTSELQEVIHTVHKELLHLNISIVGGSFIAINSEIETELHCWGSGGTAETSEEVHVPRFEKPFYTNLINGIKKGTGFFTEEYTQKEKKEFFTFLLKHEPWSKLDSKQKKETLSSPGGYNRSCCVSKHTSIFIINQFGEKFSEADNEILKRFGKVFEQAYTRFLDLQKAEAQAQEAQIETALERVRAQTMAMHHSADVGITATTMFDELVNLGVSSRSRCGIGIMDDRKHMELWTASSQADSNVDLNIGDLDMSLHPLLLGAWESWKEQKSLFEYELRGSDLTRYFTVINDAPDYSFQVDLTALPSKIFHYSFVFSYGILFAFLEEPLLQDIQNIFSRFSHVFNQTYTRFLDLKKAETQAREAQIEAALERVRAKAMAMHNSTDLNATVSLLVHELEELNIHPVRCGFGKVLPEVKGAELYITSMDKENPGLELVASIKLVGHPIFENIYQAWQNQQEYLPVLKGNNLKSYYNHLKKYLDIKTPPDDTIQYGYFTWYQDAGLYTWSGKPYSEDELRVYRKFIAVLGLTFQRYQDLKDAEARTLEAQRDASLDRVRAVIASMRTAEDLQRITPLIWKELTILEVPFFRCGIFIINEAAQQIQVFLTTPSGDSLAALNLPYGASDLIDQTLEHWKAQKTLTQEWTREQFVEWAQSIVEQGYLDNTTSYQGGLAPPEHLALHFVPFAQGMLYVGSADLLNDAQLELVQSLAEAFAVAYARYEDFKRLENAKNSLEETLKDLNSTQAQLIHAEKMASLGELTAGIAHEIQNPLNFVNNFSDVSGELLVEVKEEIKNGELNEAFVIIEDLVRNLEKIKHHGHRASNIVKGMLDHSRSSSGERVTTDINQLADEYLRLSYHGLRAKDRSFNATFETEFEENLPKISIVPQDIGRVFLNLINNAFHAVNEKAKSANKDLYKPMVRVITKLTSSDEGLGTIEITISDNGPGIPDSIKDKIFQPFFTTKPTGQGTGLGLSLAYDILKAHGGALKVRSETNMGAEFYLTIPIV